MCTHFADVSLWWLNSFSALDHHMTRLWSCLREGLAKAAGVKVSIGIITFPSEELALPELTWALPKLALGLPELTWVPNDSQDRSGSDPGLSAPQTSFQVFIYFRFFSVFGAFWRFLWVLGGFGPYFQIL